MREGLPPASIPGVYHEAAVSGELHRGSRSECLRRREWKNGEFIIVIVFWTWSIHSEISTTENRGNRES